MTKITSEQFVSGHIPNELIGRDREIAKLQDQIDSMQLRHEVELRVDRDATIERCAQVADKLRASVEAKGGENFGVISEALIEAATAIRALKDKP